MADAMSYEYLLRRIYQIGRFDSPDINADVYRALEQSERSYTLDLENIKKKQPRINAKNIDELAYEYRVQCRKVWSIIEVAITSGIKKHKGTFTESEVKEMEKSIIEPKIVTKEHIDNAISITEKIYIAHKIYPA